MAEAARRRSEPLDAEALDLDTAILLLGAPIYITGFLALAVWGWWNDRKGRRQRG